MEIKSWCVVACNDPQKIVVGGQPFLMLLNFFSDDAEPLQRKDKLLLDVTEVTYHRASGVYVLLGTGNEASEMSHLRGKSIAAMIVAAKRSGVILVNAEEYNNGHSERVETGNEDS